jgi:hypothetical protein
MELEKRMSTNELLAEKTRVLFVRVGWMRSYAGPIPGDERPVGGGSHNKTGLALLSAACPG